MSAASQIRHSFIGVIAHAVIHSLFRLRYGSASPIDYALPGGVSIRLWPEGEIAEFMAFPWLFEKTEIALVVGFLQPGMKVIDVGANIGLYSIIAGKQVGDNGVV